MVANKVVGLGNRFMVVRIREVLEVKGSGWWSFLGELQEIFWYLLQGLSDRGVLEVKTLPRTYPEQVTFVKVLKLYLINSQCSVFCWTNLVFLYCLKFSFDYNHAICKIYTFFSKLHWTLYLALTKVALADILFFAKNIFLTEVRVAEKALHNHSNWNFFLHFAFLFLKIILVRHCKNLHLLLDCIQFSIF